MSSYDFYQGREKPAPSACAVALIVRDGKVLIRSSWIWKRKSSLDSSWWSLRARWRTSGWFETRSSRGNCDNGSSDYSIAWSERRRIPRWERRRSSSYVLVWHSTRTAMSGTWEVSRVALGWGRWNSSKPHWSQRRWLHQASPSVIFLRAPRA